MAGYRILGAVLLYSSMAGGQTSSISFSFTIPPPLDTRTSAAVLDQNGIMVKTLWGGITYPPGTYNASWRGDIDAVNWITSSVVTLTANSNTFTISPMNPNIAVGQLVMTAASQNQYNYIPAGTTVTAVAGTSVTMSNPAIRGAGGLIVHFYSPATSTPGQQYTIKLLTNNVVYNYDGHLFSTDKEWYRPLKWSGRCGWTPGIMKFTFTGTIGWVACGYNEITPNVMNFDPNNPNIVIKPNRYLSYQGVHESDDIATDGQWLYVIENKSLSSWPSFVTAFDVNGMPAYLPQGTFDSTYVWPGLTSTYIDCYATVSSGPTPPPNCPVNPNHTSAIAVQRTGNVLAVYHDQQGYLAFFDKKTGASLGANFAVSNIRTANMIFTSEGLWYAGTDGNLYLITGIPAAPVITQPITGFSHVAAVGANTLTNTLYVADGGNIQQIFGFAVGTHAKIRTYGKLGGYNDCDPNLTHDRLMLDAYSNTGVYLASTPRQVFVSSDDSDNLWIEDQEGQRIQHIDPNNNYVEQILWNRAVYVIAVSQTIPTRVFMPNMLEYSVDYSKPLVPGDGDPAVGGNGDWILVRNWQVCALGAHGSPAATPGAFRAVEKLSNGRVYGLMGSILFELPEGTSPARNTGVSITNIGIAMLMPDGTLNLAIYSGTTPNRTVGVNSAPLQGFDSNNNPIYGALVTIASTTTNSSNAQLIGGSVGGVQASTNGYWPVFNAIFTDLNNYPHMAGYKVGSPSYLWTTVPERLSPVPIFTTFPQTGGNGVNRSGTQGLYPIYTMGRNFFFTFVGNSSSVGSGTSSPWWGSQYWHLWEDGMIVGQFGMNRGFPMTAGQPLAGNGPATTEDTILPTNFRNTTFWSAAPYNGDVYIYSGDESAGPAHRWHISNLASIQEFAGTTVLAPGATVTLSPIPLGQIIKSPPRRKRGERKEERKEERREERRRN